MEEVHQALDTFVTNTKAALADVQSKVEGLSAAQTQLEELNQQIGTKTEELAGLHSQIEQKSAALTQAEADHAATNEALNAREAALAQREAALTTREQQVADAEQRFQAFTGSNSEAQLLQSMQETLNSDRAKIQEFALGVDARLKEAIAKEKAIEQAKAELQSQQAAIAKKAE